MRIAICNTFGRFLGGVENYLGCVIPALIKDGHDVAMVFENDAPATHPRFATTGHDWCIAEIGVPRILTRLHEWCPDVVYAHAVTDPPFEQAVIKTAPAVLFAHDYSATCISGAKAFAFPQVKCCTQRFGAHCLVNYFPRRCGGMSPVTMWQNYYKRRSRLALIHRYSRILVASQAMRQEYLKHGFTAELIEFVPYPVAPATACVEGNETEPGGVPWKTSLDGRSDELHLLFAGRMVRLKGGHILLRALPLVTGRLERSLRLTFVGEGPQKAQWEKQAHELCAQNHSIRVDFAGWLQQADLQNLFRTCDLLVVPSLWPEPFGMIGPEAGNAGLPAAAFAVGGISEWLHDGINGFLAPADPPAPKELATAIIKCVANPLMYQQLRYNARRQATRFNLRHHVETLLEIFTRVIAEDNGRVNDPARHQEPERGRSAEIQTNPALLM
jgi:glycosyltransferase involved in cell wall biosynthesis